MTEISLPFQRGPQPKKRSWYERLVRRQRPDLAKAELVNLLAGRPIKSITPSEVSAILLDHGVSRQETRALMHRLWSHALEHFLNDDSISDLELAYINDLRRVLSMSGDEAIEIQHSLVHPRFRRAVAAVLEDGSVSTKERELLSQLGDSLRIPPALRQKFFEEPAGEFLTQVMSDAVKDHRFSPQEEADIKSLADNLGLEITMDNATKQHLERFKLFWQIENGHLPAVGVPLALQKGEVCHYESHAQWHEVRKQTTTVGYSSQGISFRIARGVYYRVGASRPHRVTTEGLTLIDEGTLYITSKRILFDGQKKNTALRLNTIIAFEPCADGIIIEKATGKSPHITLGGDAEMAAVILGAVLARQ